MWSTSSVSWAAVPFRNSTVYAKSFIRGSKPGRWPVAALTLVAFTSVKYASPPIVPRHVVVPSGHVIVPSASGRFVSPGSVSGCVRNGSGLTPRPPSMITGPRIWSVRPVIGGKTSASWPSTNELSSASTVTVCAWFQVPVEPPVKTSCCVITAPPRLSGGDRDARGERAAVVEARDREDAADHRDAIAREREVGAEPGGDVGERVAVEDGERVRVAVDVERPDLALRRLALEVDRRRSCRSRCRLPPRGSRRRARRTPSSRRRG